MDVTVVVASYGSRDWLDLAAGRAAPSAFAESVPVVVVHGLTLHGARNAGLVQVETEHVVFVDADDELEPGYVEAMAAGSCDLRAPAVRYVRKGQAQAPYVPRVAGHHHDCSAECMEAGNWCVVGTCVRTELLRAVGGWRDETLFEDWSAWARCVRAGGSLEAVPAAIYRAHVRPDSRNRAPDRAAREAAHWEIHRSVWPERYMETA